MSSLNSEQELLRQAINGDRKAITRLLHANYDVIYRHVDRRLPARFRAACSVEDVLQEVFFDAYRGIDSFSSDSLESFDSWMRVIANNRLRNCIRALRAKKRGGLWKPARSGDQSSVMDPVEKLRDLGDGPVDPLERDEVIKAVQLSVSILPGEQRQAVELCYLNGKEVSEAAAEMETTVPAIRGLLHRAKSTLRTTLGRSSKWFHSK